MWAGQKSTGNKQNYTEVCAFTSKIYFVKKVENEHKVH